MKFYVMPSFAKFMVTNITVSTKWYEEILGFTSLFQFKNDKNMVIMTHLRHSNYQDIMLIQSSNFIVGNGFRLNLSVTTIEEIATKLAPTSIIEPLMTQPWNAKEITINDPDGYLITLTQPSLEQTKDFDAVIKNSHQTYH